ncbi:hypothetical protein C0993_007546 [Termitomyces sp. T159_Od127]|nr:hypothetical protein C0993_007546 [Termitomyces sp. T159_Od127]
MARPSKLERINRPQADPQLGTPSTRPLQPGRHTSGFLAPDPRHPFEQSVPAQHTPIVPAFGSVTTAALHNLLSDTATGQQPQSNTYLTSKGHHSRSPSPSSSKRVDSPLPTLPRQETLEAGLPSVLLPGSGRPRTPSYTYTAPELPSTLRTRTGRAVSSPTPSQHVPTSSQQTFVGSTGLLAQHNGIAAPNVSNNKAYTLGPTPIILSSRNSHLIPGSTNTPPLFSSDSTAAQPPYGVPVSMTSQWLPEAASTESFSFPVPMLSVPAPGELPSQENYVPPPVQANHTYISPPAGYGPPPPQVDYPSKSGYLQASYPSQPISQHWQQPSFQDRTSDPLLQTRYSTPLPLPPGSGIPPRGQQIGSSVTAANRDQTRLEALRGVENETERRKTQEEMDRELALALDRELNLEGPRG